MGDKENKDKVTTKDIAAKLGVSTATVHRAIYGKPGVGEKLRSKILKEVEAAHYVIDGTAPLEVVKVGDIVKVKVLDIDPAKKRISLTMKGV